jgi:hypothetical protein
VEQSPDCVGLGDGMDVDTKDGTSKMTQQGEEVDKP